MLLTHLALGGWCPDPATETTAGSEDGTWGKTTRKASKVAKKQAWLEDVPWDGTSR